MQQSFANFLFAVFYGYEMSAIVEPPMTAFSMTCFKTDRHTVFPAEMSNSPDEFRAIHGMEVSYISVRVSRLTPCAKSRSRRAGILLAGFMFEFVVYSLRLSYHSLGNA